MVKRYNRLLENMIEFWVYSEDFLKNNKEEESFVNNSDIEVYSFNDIDICRGYRIQEVQG